MYLQHFVETKYLSASAIAKHLREVLGRKEFTAAKAQEEGKEKLVKHLVAAYREQGLPLDGAPGYPWPTAAGQPGSQKPQRAVAQAVDVDDAEEQTPRVQVPVQGGQTMFDRSKKLADQRIKALQIPDGAEHLVDPETEEPLIDPMKITGPGFVHPYYLTWPILPPNQEYRAMILLEPRENRGDYGHVVLNGEGVLIRRDTPVALKREHLDVLLGAFANESRAKTNEKGEVIAMAWGEEVRFKRVRTESVQVIGDVVTDSKGNVLRWIQRFDGEPLPQPRRYDPDARPEMAV